MKLLLVLALLQAAPGQGGPTGPAPWRSAEDAALEAANRLIEAGLPLSAGDLLSRYMSLRTDPGPPSPQVVLLAARAYADGRAWPSVLRLLHRQLWLEEAEQGSGLLHLARAYAGLDSLEAALAAHERYLAAAEAEGWEPDRERETAFRVGYASVLSRLGEHVAAAAQYAAAAVSQPALSHWFLLSELQELARTGDLEGARDVAVRLKPDSVVPRDSVRQRLALAAFRSGDYEIGLEEARRLPPRAAAALTAEWIAPAHLAAGDSAGALGALRAAIEIGAGSGAGGLLLELAPGWETRVEVAATESRAGRSAAAVRHLREALAEAPPSQAARIRLALAQAQFAARDYQGVVWTLGPWMEGVPPASGAVDDATVWLLAGRSFSRLGARAAAEDAFRRSVEAGFRNPSAFAAYLLADHLQDDGRLEEARAAYARAISRYPRSGWAARSLIRLGMLAFLDGEYEEARDHFDTYRRRYRNGSWYHATIYWTARSLEAAGDTSTAGALYREAVGHSPLSYYGQLAASRAGLDAYAMATRPGGPPSELAPQRRELLRRIETLRALGWSGRAARELNAALREERPGAAELLPLAHALNERGWTRRGIRLGLQARGRQAGRWSEDALRAVYPLPYRAAIEEMAGLRGLGVALLAGLIRRESLFEADVVSSAGAVGMMQLLPRTAIEMSREAGLEGLILPQLEVPEVNLRLGTLYLARMLDRFDDDLPAALIAYNAGPHRYLRWRGFPERNADTELFVERIPFRETRIYTKEVSSGALIYARLYDLRDGIVDGL